MKKNIEGRKVKGFKFDSSLDLVYIESDMDEYIGEVGEIESRSNKHVKVRFEEDWFYPLDQIEEHLVPEYEIGKEYEFSYDGECWSAPMKLVGIIDHEYKYLVDVRSEATFYGYKKIREIKPKVKELTLEEAEETLTAILGTVTKLKKQ